MVASSCSALDGFFISFFGVMTDAGLVGVDRSDHLIAIVVMGHLM